MNTLPAPTTPNKSHADVSALTGFADRLRHAPRRPPATHHERAAAVRQLRVRRARTADRIEHRVVVSIHRDGIPAVIAELQRLMGES